MTKKLFIVDDSNELRKAYKRYIENRTNEYEFREARNGLEAQKILFEENYIPDYMILDNQMPVMGGMELLRIIHKEGLTQKIRLAIGSGSITKVLREEIESYNVKIFEKPFNLQDLINYFK